MRSPLRRFPSGASSRALVWPSFTGRKAGPASQVSGVGICAVAAAQVVAAAMGTGAGAVALALAALVRRTACNQPPPRLALSLAFAPAAA
eukprot:scaffold81103_cov28-Tisochrysis_lutea.AAC.5